MEINALTIKNYRKKHNLTQEDLAEIIGVSFRTVQNYEAGGNIPKSKHAILRKILYCKKEESQDAFNEENDNYQKTTNSEIEAHNKTLLNQLNKYIKDLEAVKKPNLIDLRQLKEAITLKAELQKELRKL